MGVAVEKHHHEVAAAQHELGIKFGPMITMADHMQIYKYVVHNVAQAYGKTATFMPKPIFGDNGSGMHVPPVDLEGRQADVRRRQVRRPVADCASTTSAASSSTPRPSTPSPTRPTNSYKRLVPGYEAPVMLAYSARNRSASMPHPARDEPEGASASRSASRIRRRNPYLAFTAMLMAGLDGIENKIDPGDADGQEPLRPAAGELTKIPTVCGSLREALDSLDKDRGFLKAGGVMNDDMIDAYIELKMEENMRYEMTRIRSNSTCTTRSENRSAF